MKRVFCGLVLLLSGMLISGCSTLYSFGIGVKSNLPPPAKLVNFQPKLKVTPVWSRYTGASTGGLNIKLLPALYQNMIITAGTKGTVTAVNAQTGRTLWSHRFKASFISGPAVGHGIVAVNTDNGYLVAINPNNGQLLWNAALPTQALAAPKIASGKVYDKTIDGHVMAFSVANGHKLWSYKHGAPTLILRGSSVPQYAEGKIVAGFADGRVAVLNANNGNVYWERTIAIPRGLTQIEQMVDIDADPRVSNGIVYVATYQGNIAALVLSNGQNVWRHKISSYAGIALGQQQVYISDASSHIWALDRNFGGVDWRQTQLNYRFITGPVIQGKAIIVADREGYVHWLSQSDGQFLARVFVNRSGIIAPPVVQGDMVYVLTQNGYLAAYKVTPLH